MRRFVTTTVLLVALLVARAGAHEVHHTIIDGDTIVVELTHGGGAPFANERYQVFRPDANEPFQTGLTDVRGRVAFVPDRAGDWRVRAFSEDGHGVDLVVPTRAETEVETQVEPGGTGRGVRIAVGVLVLFGVFGIAARLLKKRPPTQ